eukprot:scaffold118433_cov66-Phaeocystis_antarctica.AAC.2
MSGTIVARAPPPPPGGAQGGCQARPIRAHTHVRASPGDCVRRAGRKRGARFKSSEALAEQPAVARIAVELHRRRSRPSTY